MNAQTLMQELQTRANEEKAKIHARFFKTGKGEYGEGDIFWGIPVPDQRKIAKKYFGTLPFSEIRKLVSNKIHECRLTGFLLLTYQFEKATEKEKEKIFRFYLQQKKYANNWDIIDVTCPKILGEYLFAHQNEKSVLFSLAKSNSLWDRRLAMLATFPFIKNRAFSLPLQIAEILASDTHPLIHKAVGWMLREIGKIDREKEEAFLKKHIKTLSRTTLRYAIERFSPEKRQKYLSFS